MLRLNVLQLADVKAFVVHLRKETKCDTIGFAARRVQAETCHFVHTAVPDCSVDADGLWIRDVFEAQSGDLVTLTDRFRDRPAFRRDECCGVRTLWVFDAVVGAAETIVRIAFDVSQIGIQQPIIVSRAKCSGY